MIENQNSPSATADTARELPLSVAARSRSRSSSPSRRRPQPADVVHYSGNPAKSDQPPVARTPGERKRADRAEAALDWLLRKTFTCFGKA